MKSDGSVAGFFFPSTQCHASGGTAPSMCHSSRFLPESSPTSSPDGRLNLASTRLTSRSWVLSQRVDRRRRSPGYFPLHLGPSIAGLQGLGTPLECKRPPNSRPRSRSGDSDVTKLPRLRQRGDAIGGEGLSHAASEPTQRRGERWNRAQGALGRSRDG
jgi:hypothetical protein